MAAAAKKAASKPDASVRPAKVKDVLTVTAPLVAVKNADGVLVNLYYGDVIPDGTQQESIDHLFSLEYVK